MTRKELDAIALEVEGMMTTDPYDWIEYHQEYARRLIERIACPKCLAELKEPKPELSGERSESA